MTRLKYITFLAVIAAITLSNSFGRDQGLSGAPGDSTCAGCHSGTGSGSIDLTGVPAQIIPGQTYSLTLTVSDNTNSIAGFQIVATDGTNNTQQGSFTTISGTKLITGDRLTHNTPLSISSGSASWTFDWEAPVAVPASGQIQFYYAGIAANGINGQDVGDFTYSGSSSLIPLPVELISFTGIARNESVILEWVTASEENNAGFELQRSQNGDEWEVLDYMDGNGTTFETQYYSYTDNNPIDNGYYRLKQIDFDGAFEYSRVIQVERNIENNAIKIYPNPTADKIYFNESINSAIELFSANGQLIKNYGVVENSMIDLTEFNNGLYYIAFKNAQGERVVKKVLKQ